MTAPEAIHLIEAGGTDNLRGKIKKLGIHDRLKFLNKCIPYISKSPKSILFFKQHFSMELGAIGTADGDVDKAYVIFERAMKR